MLLFLRRSLVVIALSFWQGGFTFYASVVVPVAQTVLGHLRQGFVTQQVTVYLNLAGAAALVVLAWDQFAARSCGKWQRWSRWLLWLAMGVSLLLLVRLHSQLDDLLVFKGRIIRDMEAFHALHRVYLWISTVQWACGLLYLLLTLVIWRREDAANRENEPGQKKVPPLASSASPSHRSRQTAERELS